MWPWTKKKTKKVLKELPFTPPEVIPGSSAEVLIHKTLSKYGVTFEREKMFEGLINPQTGKSLRYDFWLPEYNTLIEYNGKQHYKYHKDYHDADPEIAKEQLSKSRERDFQKIRFCYMNKIHLIVLKAKDYYHIEEELVKRLNLNGE